MGSTPERDATSARSFISKDFKQPMHFVRRCKLDAETDFKMDLPQLKNQKINEQLLSDLLK